MRYARMGVEIHFPLMLQPTTTIYALTFLEGGNAWTSVKEFNPFSLKRSAGAGLRIYLPMVGMMGIDWAYGFDRVRGEKAAATSTSSSVRNSKYEPSPEPRRLNLADIRQSNKQTPQKQQYST